MKKNLSNIKKYLLKRCLLNSFLLLFFCFSISSCGVYRQNILFTTKGDLISNKLLFARMSVETNYILQKNDRISFKVYSNNGQELKAIAGVEQANTNVSNSGGGQGAAGAQGGGGSVGGMGQVGFLIEINGEVELPMIGKQMLDGLKLSQADSLLSNKFTKFYPESYVRTQCISRRVIVLKGGTGMVVPLVNENVSVIEVLAQTGGFPNDHRARNVRLIRGDLQKPNVFLIDLSTIEGMQRVNLTVQPNDIIYVEPVRKTFVESLNDFSPIIASISSVISLVAIIITLRR